MSIRAAWLHKKLPFRIGSGRAAIARFGCNAWASFPHLVKLPRRARLTFSADSQVTPPAVSSLTHRSAGRGCQRAVSRLVLVRSAYACSAIYQQFFVP
jgi:hypothetical protein